jgi:quinol monooxygenase YgiN
MHLPLGLLARIEAKPDHAQEVHDLLTGALPLARAEEGTVAWFAFRLGPTTFGVFDAFGTDDARRAHLEGRIAEALLGEGARLLADTPDIRPVDILATKLPTPTPA